MNRILTSFALLGCLVAVDGIRSLAPATQATREPLRVHLSDLESGRTPMSPHLRIGSHWAMYQELIYTRSNDAQAGEDAADELAAVYYPIVAADHAAIRELEHLARRFGGVDQIPPDRHPELNRFRILVRTDRYDHIESLPDPEWTQVESVSGLVANHLRPLTAHEVDLVRSNFAAIETPNLMILDEGRTPSSPVWSYTRIGGGAFLALALLAIAAHRTRRAGSPQGPTVEAP